MTYQIVRVRIDTNSRRTLARLRLQRMRLRKQGKLLLAGYTPPGYRRTKEQES